MQINDTSSRADTRYEPDERPPYSICIGLGLQAALLVFPSVVLVPVIIVRAAGLAVILLTIIMKLTGPRRYSIVTALDPRVLHRLEDFLREQAQRLGWGDTAAERLFLIGEETLLCLAEGHDEAATGELRRLLVTATNDGPVMELEFVSAIGEDNLEDQMRLLGDHGEARDGHEIALRILQHYASSVRHQQYHGMDVVTVRVRENDN